MYIRVKVKPGSKKESIVKKSDNVFEIEVREKAKSGMANKRVCEIIRKYFNDPVGGVKIINGHTTPTKLLRIGNT